MKKRIVLALVMFAALLTVVAPRAEAATCSNSWGSGAKSAGSLVPGPLLSARAGGHDCYDRLVLEVEGKAPGYRVQYVDQVYTEGSGRIVPLRGGAKLQVVALAPSYRTNGTPTFPALKSELVDVTGYKTFRQVAGAGSFEGQTTIGVGVRARLPFTVTRLAGPGTHSRLVIDVAHNW